MFVINEDEVLDLCRKTSSAYQSMLMNVGFSLPVEDVRLYLPSSASIQDFHQVVIDEMFQSSSQQDYNERYQAFCLVLEGVKQMNKVPPYLLKSEGQGRHSLNNEKFKDWFLLSFTVALQQEKNCRAIFNQHALQNRLSETDLTATCAPSPSKTKSKP